MCPQPNQTNTGVAALLRLRTLIDRTHDGIFLVAIPHGEIVDSNASATRLTGRSKEALHGATIEDVVGSEAWSRLAEMVDDTHTDPGIPRMVRVEIESRGDSAVVELSLGYHGFQDGLFGVVVMRDVTERERAVQELNAAHSRMRDMIEFLPDPTLVLGTDGVVLEWNRALELLTGVPKKAMIGKGEYECAIPIYGRRYPLLAHRVLGLAGSWDAAPYEIMERTTDRFEAGVFAPALRGGRGAHLWVSASALRDAKGHMIGAIESLRDQTERLEVAQALRANERDLRATLDSISDAVVTTDARGIVQRMNPAAEKLTNWTSAQAAERPLAEVVELLDSSSRERVEHPEFRILRARDDHAMHEDLLLVARGGQERRVSARGGPILGDFKDVIGFVVVIRDVTEQRAVARQLTLAQRMESVGRLASGVAHDFNNVLAVIRGYADMIGEDLPPESHLLEDVSEILAASERAHDLTRRLLAFGKADACEIKTVDVHKLVTALQRMVARLIGENIELRFALDAKHPCVRADPSQIEQVFLNLVLNSRDAMPGGGVLTIATHDVDLSEDEGATLGRGTRCLQIIVQDSGVGMAEETRRRAFEPFFSTKGPERGNGIGLSTSFEIVQQLGGSIELKSALGEGTTFVIKLPMSECDDVSGPTSSIRPAVDAAAATVLVAEDEPVLLRLIDRILAKRGYRILTARNGVEALAVSRAHGGDIDLLVTDVVMPEMGGVELQKQLRQERGNIKTLFVSGYSFDAVVQQGLVGDKPGFLAKPFTARRLVSKVVELLDLHEV